jgi:hypothetical protein
MRTAGTRVSTWPTQAVNPSKYAQLSFLLISLDLYSAFSAPRAALGAKRRVCYPCSTADSHPQWALTACFLSQSTASQKEKSMHCHCYGSILRPSAPQRTALNTRPCLAPIVGGVTRSDSCGAFAVATTCPFCCRSNF